MKKDDIVLNKIKAQIGNNIRFPKYISFSIEGNRLFVNIVAKGVTANMQTDSSAFEGWIICLMACLSNEICDVVLSWEIPVFDEGEKDNTLKQHYNRFVFRAMMFEKVYNWVTVSSVNRDEINRLKIKLSHAVINYPKSESKEKVSDNGKVHKGEAILERQLVTIMRESFPITDHQLPVGLFDRTVKTRKALTPRGASQIDIWQLDHGVLRIFELKDKENNSIGIISELMFYVYVMCLLVRDKIKFPDSLSNEKKNIRHINDLYASIVADEVKSIEAVFLIFKFHPLIEQRKDDVMRILNEGMNKIRVSFGYKTISQILR